MMNIFALDNNTQFAAQAHHNRHVCKMIIETAQLLSTTWHVLTGEDEVILNRQRIYKKTHEHHPCAIWARASRENYDWLWSLGYNLCLEYTLRYRKTHATTAVISALHTVPGLLPDKGLTPFAQVMPDEFKRPNDPVEAYREYYRQKKIVGQRWTNRQPPVWL